MPVQPRAAILRARAPEAPGEFEFTSTTTLLGVGPLATRSGSKDAAASLPPRSATVERNFRWTTTCSNASGSATSSKASSASSAARRLTSRACVRSAQTKMTIPRRATVNGVPCDIVCTGRFYDFFEQRNSRWAIVLRQPIYEKDRLDPIPPEAAPQLGEALLAQFPEEYRHLAHAQTRLGYAVKRDMPGLKGPEVRALYAKGRAWLANGAIGG